MAATRTPPDRSKLFERLGEDEIVARYRRVFGPRVGLEEARAQARLEAELTDRLLLSTPENRWSEFSDAYSRLFRELPWHRSIEQAGDVRDHACWGQLLGKPKKILEIGSGGGGLIRDLARRGHQCHGAEITKERGRKYVSDGEGIEWLETDGVNLSRFVGENGFDAIVSDQVFEHLHPDDHLTHLSEARKVLRPGGRYILRAPHRSTGPHDLSEIFGLDDAVFLHLCEPTYTIAQSLCRQAGFDRVAAVLALRRFRFAFASSLFRKYQVLIERIEARATATQEGRRRFRKLAKGLFASGSVWIVAEKPRADESLGP
jgi:cyclopropane fatty-acyl-phospholipid synthase-like methyltransferase